MGGLSELVTIIFSVVVLILSIFVIVHATIQIKNSQLMLTKDKEQSSSDRKKLHRHINIIIIAIFMFALMFLKVIQNFNSYKASEYEKDNYAISVSDLNDALNLEFSVYGKDTYSSDKDLALSLDFRLPVKNLYYVATRDEETMQFQSYEILKYRLKEFQNKPTLITYDGILMSIIKFKEGCKYVNTKYIGKSDCIIEVDVNNFDEPNQIGKDRVLFAIDGLNNTVKTDSNFFNK